MLGARRRHELNGLDKGFYSSRCCGQVMNHYLDGLADRYSRLIDGVWRWVVYPLVGLVLVVWLCVRGKR